MSSKEIIDGLNEAQKYLQEQADLFGNTIYVDGKKGKEGASLPSAERLPDEPWAVSSALEDLNRSICTCIKCPLGHTRTRFVFGVGNPNADLMFVGEAPGKNEDITFDQVVALAFPNPPTGDGVQFTVQFTRGEGNKPTGTLVEGQSVKVKDGMEFDVTSTNRS